MDNSEVVFLKKNQKWMKYLLFNLPNELNHKGYKLFWLSVPSSAHGAPEFIESCCESRYQVIWVTSRVGSTFATMVTLGTELPKGIESLLLRLRMISDSLYGTKAGCNDTPIICAI